MKDIRGIKKKNEKHISVNTYFYTHVFHLLDFDTNDIVNTNYIT